MRVLFFCRTVKTKLMVHLAKGLKEMGKLAQASAFVAYYDEWRDYLRNQKEVKFDHIYGTKEIFNRMGHDKLDYTELRRIEHEYGEEEIWNAIFSERCLASLEHQMTYNHPRYSDADVLRYVQICFQVAERIFDEIQPDCIVDFASVGIYRGVFDLVAKQRGVPYFHISNIHLADRFYISRHVHAKYENIYNTYERLLESGSPCEAGWKYLRQFREANQGSIYTFHLLLDGEGDPSADDALKKGLSSVSGHIWWPLSLARGVLKETDLRLTAARNPEVRYNFQLYKSLPSIRLYRAILSLARKAALWVRSPFEDGPLPRDYVLMTLHVIPEASTSIAAPFFANQRFVIENVARALPLHWRLVTKPHLLMMGKEPLSFYRHIQKIPNVQVVSPYANTRDLALNSRAVVAISGTSGLEAALLGKKVILFGQPDWGMIHGVTRCTDFTQLHAIFKEVKNYKVDDNDLAAYLQAVHDHSFPMERNYVWKGPYDLSNPGYKQAIEEIARQVVIAYQENEPQRKIDVGES